MKEEQLELKLEATPEPNKPTDWKTLFFISFVLLVTSAIIHLIRPAENKVVDTKITLQINSSIGMLDFYPRLNSAARIQASTNVDFGVYDISIRKQ